MKSFYRLIRSLLRIRKPTIDEEQALQITKDECLRRGWKWEDLQPLLIKEHLRSYEIWTNADKLGGRVKIDIDFYSRRVKSVRALPR